MRILRIVGSSELPCGCFVGRYELYDGQTVQVIDEESVSCDIDSHEVGAVVPALPGDAATPSTEETADMA